ncbi:unnamed protein product [Brassicogethes aeneus]|uniref:Endonuclease/exonuclease/phosphatase domain-containing protein n=1 Tax=Brassicogethes aeneus TaxID=1431903 RepID=A0A9P0FN19_BRAAE|nr:unnamed protein product [Brassicogethes aeneus]
MIATKNLLKPKNVITIKPVNVNVLKLLQIMAQQGEKDNKNPLVCSNSGSTLSNRSIQVTWDVPQQLTPNQCWVESNPFGHNLQYNTPGNYHTPWNIPIRPSMYHPGGYPGYNYMNPNYNYTSNDQGIPGSYFYYNVVPDSMSTSYSDTSMSSRYYSTHTLHREHSDSDLVTKKTKKKNGNIQSIRVWEDAKSSKDCQNKNEFCFTLMSYNVLAQDLIDRHIYLYKKHSKRFLKWQLRWENLISEIEETNPHILCLQEVQESHIPSYYDRLKLLGYDYIFKKRTNHYTDGCAIYYKTSKLSLKEHLKVEYKQSEIPPLNRENVGIVAKFEPRSHPGEEFVVATTHLLYNPKRDDVRLAQVQLLLAEIDRVAFKRFEDCKPVYVPIIITGDFNSLPNSSVYGFVTQGQLDLKECFSSQTKGLLPKSLGITKNSQHANLQLLNNLTGEEKMSFINLRNTEYNSNPLLTCQSSADIESINEISHNFPLKSVYKHFNVDGDNEGTTHQNKWVTVDYIFYSGKRSDCDVVEDNIKLLERMTLPTSLQLNNTNIPDRDNGSDHLSLSAKFKLEF